MKPCTIKQTKLTNNLEKKNKYGNASQPAALTFKSEPLAPLIGFIAEDYKDFSQLTLVSMATTLQTSSPLMAVSPGWSSASHVILHLPAHINQLRLTH